ncbi:hypothetical protein [Rhodobacteraceae bacterium DSL-40]|uniref:hypothetical protein n=1 Tax=Amaricoccus sp. B4 TaxID=3368557 RepID=UPI000DACFCF2
MTDYAKAMAALKDADAWLPADKIEAIAQFLELFEPYAGDDPEEAQARTPVMCRCSNCGLTSPAFFTPAPLARAARAALRRGVCPRCYSTELLMVSRQRPE